jgi:hypothetical protein
MTNPSYQQLVGGTSNQSCFQQLGGSNTGWTGFNTGGGTLNQGGGITSMRVQRAYK